MRPIDADELHPIELDLMLAVPYEDIKDAPTIDRAFIKYGIWSVEEGEYTCLECGWTGTVCCMGEEQIGRKKVSFCPNCGSKMKV